MNSFAWSVPTDLPPRVELIGVADKQVVASVVAKQDGKWHWNCSLDARQRAGACLTLTDAKLAVLKNLSS